MRKKQLIIGIDPGTTTGIAALDLDGQPVLIDSRKNMSKHDIMSFVSSIGNPLIIASDIFPTPRLLEKVAASLPTRIISPRMCLSKKDKSQMVKEYSEKLNNGKIWNNTHEKDALASALFAYGRLKALIERVKKRLDSSEILEEDVRDSIMKDVLLEKTSITSSIKQYPEALFKYKIAHVK